MNILDLLHYASYSVEDLTVMHSVLSNHLMIRERKHGYALQLSEMPTIQERKGWRRGRPCKTIYCCPRPWRRSMD